MCGMCAVSGGTYAYLHVHICAWGECMCLCVVCTCVSLVCLFVESTCVSACAVWLWLSQGLTDGGTVCFPAHPSPPLWARWVPADPSGPMLPAV